MRRKCMQSYLEEEFVNEWFYNKQYFQLNY